MANSSAHKGGRPKLGERKSLVARIPVDQHRVYEEKATAAGLSLSSWAVARLAELEDLPIPDHIQAEIRQAYAERKALDEKQEFPMADTG